MYNNQARKQWLVGQAVKTLASHAENMGSIPVRVTNRNLNRFIRFRFLFLSRTHIEHTQNTCVLSMGSHTPPEDLKARFQGVGCGYIHL